MKKILLAIIFTIFLIPSITFCNTITGKVIKVADGDTITILTKHYKPVKIRLYGIDTPEKRQAFGNKAKKFTANLVAGNQVSVKIYATDRYKRSVGVVFVGGTNVNEEIVRAGYAWQYRKYCKKSFCNGWLKLEHKARNSRIGLWRDKNPIAPWDWRKAKRNGGSGKKSNVAGGVGIYHGNKKSKVFHGLGCQHYNCKNCTVVFKSTKGAVKAGYRGHRGCVK